MPEVSDGPRGGVTEGSFTDEVVHRETYADINQKMKKAKTPSDTIQNPLMPSIDWSSNGVQKKKKKRLVFEPRRPRHVIFVVERRKRVWALFSSYYYWAQNQPTHKVILAAKSICV